MQRLAKFGYGYAAALLAAAALGAEAAGWGFPVLLAFSGVGLCVRRFRKSATFWCLIAAALLAFGAFFAYTRLVFRPAVGLDGSSPVVRGTVGEIGLRSGGYRYELEVFEVDGVPVSSFGVSVSSEEVLDVTYGDLLETPVRLSRLDGTAEGTFFDSRKAHGVFLSGRLTSEKVTVTPGTGLDLRAVFRRFRDTLSDSVRRFAEGDAAEIAVGMLFGGRSALSEVRQVTFSRAGVSHLFSVSGLHMTIVAQLMLTLLAALRVGRRLSAGLCMGAVVGFMLLAGCTPSVLRSGVMMLLLLFGRLFDRSADGLNSLGIACLLIALPNPYAMYDVGFLLSVTATLGILLFGRSIERRLCALLRIRGRFGKGVAALFGVSVSPLIGMLPVMLFCFEELSLVGMLLNPLIALFVTAAMFSGFGAAFLGLVPFFAPVASVFGRICSWAVTAIDRGASLAVRLPFAFLPLGRWYLRLWILGCAAILVLFWMTRRRKGRFALLASVTLVCLILPLSAELVLRRNSVWVTAVRSDYGSAVLLQADGTTVVYGPADLSTEAALCRELRAQGVRRVDLYLQPEGGRSRQAAGAFAELFEVTYLALGEDARSAREAPASFNEEQLLSREGLSVDFGTLALEISGEKAPVLTAVRKGERYEITPELTKERVETGETVRLIVAGQVSADRDRLPAETVLLLSPRENAGEPEKGVIPGYRRGRTRLICLDGGGTIEDIT